MSAEPDASDVSIELNQLELPEEFGEAGLAAMQAELNSSGLRVDVVVEPASAPRDFIVLPALLAIHFLSGQRRAASPVAQGHRAAGPAAAKQT
jgi:hypothetical protein